MLAGTASAAVVFLLTGQSTIATIAGVAVSSAIQGGAEAMMIKGRTEAQSAALAHHGKALYGLEIADPITTPEEAFELPLERRDAYQNG